MACFITYNQSIRKYKILIPFIGHKPHRKINNIKGNNRSGLKLSLLCDFIDMYICFHNKIIFKGLPYRVIYRVIYRIKLSQ